MVKDIISDIGISPRYETIMREKYRYDETNNPRILKIIFKDDCDQALFVMHFLEKYQS